MNVWKRNAGPFFLLAAIALALSCGTKEENTMVGAGFVNERLWAVPVVDDTLTRFTGETWFEVSVRPGAQEDLLIGNRRKFLFWTAVYFDTLPAAEDTIVGARLTAVPSWSEGGRAVRIDRVTDSWSETSVTETLGVDPAMSVDASFAPGLDVEIPVEWIRSWVDSSGENHGLLVRPAEGEEGYFRVPSRETAAADDSLEIAGDRYRLHVTVSSGGSDSVIASSSRLDRFYAFKIDTSSYVVQNLDSARVLVGMRESMTNQSIFSFDLPEELKTVTVNQAQLILTLDEVTLEENETIELVAHEVLNDSLVSDSISFSSAMLGAEEVSPDAAPGDTVAITLTDVMRSWFFTGEWSPIVLVRATTESAADHHLRFRTEGADRPRMRLLYTPLRPATGGE